MSAHERSRQISSALQVYMVMLTIASSSMPSQLSAAPIIASVSAHVLMHGVTFQLNGSRFGQKAYAPPLVWDNGSGDVPTLLWDGAWPSKSSNPSFNLHYARSERGINPPHLRDPGLLAGAHGENGGAYSGSDVNLFKRMTLSAFPAFFYASWYQRSDPNWVFGGDNNYKVFDYSTGSEPYAQTNWYIAYGTPHPNSVSDTPQWIINDDANSLQNPDANGNSFWWTKGKSPMGGWEKIEVAIKATPSSDGYIKVWEDGVQVVDYAGSTDKYPGTARTIAIGGFARMSGQPTNWRYFDDIYLDYGLSRVVLADSPTLAKAKVVEIQIPQSWTDSQITATANLGKFAPSQAVYVFVVDSTGAVSNAIALTADPVVPSPTGSVAKPKAPLLH